MVQKSQSNILIDDVTAFNNGKIDFKELRRRQYIAQQKAFFPRLMELKNAEKWQEFITLSLTVYELMPIAFKYFDEIPDELKYNFAIEAYTNHGDAVPAVRHAVRNAKKYGRPNLPAAMAAADHITIYRAGEEIITKCKYRISWTTNKDTALFFLNTYAGRHASHLYKAKIKPADIIAYTNDRKESEIMQYMKVYDIEEITPENPKKSKV